ncbi:MAG: hypothetical protein MUF40_05155 [Gemmatimonadaceae bacterium]|jgi:hypothetical protein|nr:hypothetical protein [Gemmatimonadaceae bacterium]
MRSPIVLAALALAPLLLGAQAVADDAPRPRRGAIGLRGVSAQPVGAFGDAVNVGWGGGIDGRWHLDRAGFLSLRADVDFIGHGRRRQPVSLVPAAGSLIRGRLTTTNTFATLLVGAEAAQPDGPLRPYVHGGLGAAYFRTGSSLGGSDRFGEENFATTNVSDWARMSVVGGGLRIPLERGRRTETLLDLGVRRAWIGPTTYATPDDIVQGFAGPDVVARRSRTDHWLITAGFTFAY